MWDDVVIGKGEHICSAVKCFEDTKTGLYISENRNSYWISGIIMDGGMKIFKDTKEGQKLTELLTRPVKPNARGIGDYINKQYLQHVKPVTLLALIANAKRKAFEEGRESKLLEIQNVLGIYQ